MEEKYKVFVKLDSKNKVLEINSNAFLESLEGWHQIDEGTGDKYHHAQSHYFSKPLLDEKGCHNYKWQDGQAVETTAEEKEQEVAQKPPVLPSEETRLEALEKAVLSMMMGGAGNV